MLVFSNNRILFLHQYYVEARLKLLLVAMFKEGPTMTMPDFAHSSARTYVETQAEEPLRRTLGS